MFIFNKVLLAPDDNTGGDSSTSPDVNGADSSTQVVADDNQQQEEASTTEETPAEGAEASTETPGEEAEVGDQTNDQPTEEAAETATPAAVDKAEDAKLDFHKHPRFQELISEKNTYKQKLEAVEPQAARIRALDQYMQQNSIRQDQLQQALEYLRHLNTDPAKAYEVLKPTFERLAQYTGAVLPTDLAEKVASGMLSDQDAKELAQARARQQHQSFQQQQQGMTAQQQLVAYVDQTIQNWAQSKMQTDVDLKPGSPRWKYLDAAIKAERFANPNMQPQDAVALVEKLYADAGQMFRATAKPAVKKAIKSTNNNGKASPVVKTAEDVTRAILAGRRPHDLRYS